MAKTDQVSIMIDTISNSVTPKRGTSRESGISARERQRRSETERLAEFTKDDERRRMEERENLRQNMANTDMRWFRFHQAPNTRRPLYDPDQ